MIVWIAYLRVDESNRPLVLGGNQTTLILSPSNKN
jgi:hypothetical protein